MNGGKSWQRLLAPVLWIILLCITLRATAAPLPVNGREDNVHLAPHAQIFEDPSGELDLGQVRAQSSAWKNYHKEAFSFSLSRSAWWIRLSVVNTTTAPQAMVFSLGSSNVDFVHWFVLDPQGEPLLDNVSGDHTPFTTRLLQYRELGLPYTLAPQEQIELYVRVASYDGLYEIIPMRLFGARAFMNNSHSDDLLMGTFLGGMLALALFNLLLFISTRERNYGLYVLYLSALLLNSFCIRGYDLELLWPQSPDWHNCVIGFSASLSFATGGLFMLHYLRLRERLPRWLHNIATTFIGLNFFGALLGLFDYYRLAAICAALFGVPTLLLLYVISLVLIRRGVHEARYIALAFSILLIGVVVFYMVGAGMLTPHSWSSWGIQIGSAIEMLLLAFSLANSMNIMKSEKLQAERHAREAQQTFSGKLGQLVEERTHELELANHKLHELAITDELTGAFNRRHFNHQFAATLDTHHRSEPLALCIFDLDNFKAYNDTYGHLAGDQVLRSVTARIGDELRRSGDCVFRLGGEEFGVLFSAATPDLARQFIERLRLAVMQLDIPHVGNQFRIVTASFGVAWWKPSNKPDTTRLSPNQFYAAADDVLYGAKKAGRNQVMLSIL